MLIAAKALGFLVAAAFALAGIAFGMLWAVELI